MLRTQPCQRCSHNPDSHRFDDYLLPQMDSLNIPWENRPFRCLGSDMQGCSKNCSDFVGSPIDWSLSDA